MPGKRCAKPASSPGQEADRERQKAADRDLAFQRVAQVDRILREILRVLEKEPRLVDHLFAGRRQGDAARMMADEQRHADFGLDLGDGAGNRGLRHVEAFRRGRHVPAIGRRHHVAQLAQGHVHRDTPAESEKLIQIAGRNYFTDLVAARKL